jgi:hypothetical protein
MEGQRELRRILDYLGSSTALLVHNDGAVATLPMPLHDAGLDVPGDLSFSLCPSRL